jgi:hypothetical protein
MITQFYYLRRAEIAWDGEEEEEGESVFSAHANEGGKEEKGMTEKKEIRTILGEQKGQCGTRSWKQDGNTGESGKGLGEYEKKKSKERQETASIKDSEKGKGITAGKASQKSKEMENEKRKLRESVVEVKRGGESEFKRGRETDKWMASGSQFTCLVQKYRH